MKKYLILLIAIISSYSVNAQCLGEDCSIKGRNQARKQKTAKMTGKRAGGGSMYSVGGGRKNKRRGGSSQGFDPFAGGSDKDGGAGGFDPFAEYDKKNKKGKKGGVGYDPFASGDKKGKYKGRTASGGFDPFDDKKSKGKGKNDSQGYDPFADNSKSKGRGKKGGGTWTASDGKRKLKVDYSSPYNDWDGSARGSSRGRGRANDSWVGGATASAKVNKGGGTWADGSGGGKSSRGKANDSWVGGNDRKGVSKGGGTWADGSGGKSGRGKGSPKDSWGKGTGDASVSSGGGIWAQGNNTPNSNRANKYENGSNNWENVDLASTTAPPRYERVDNSPKSYSDYENSSMSGDLIYDRPYQYKYSLIAGKIYPHTKDIRNYFDGANLRPILGAEFGIEWPTVGSKNYHHYYNIPTLGLGFTYLNLGNEDLLGSAFAIYPYIDVPLLSTDPVDINLSGGFGLGGVTKWNTESPSNTDGEPVVETMPMFSSPLNVYIKGGLNVAIRPFTNVTNAKLDRLSHYTFMLGTYLAHMSNGNFASPNHGLNMFTAELGMKYTPPVLTPTLRKSGETLPHYFTVDVMGSAFMRELDRLDTKKYLVGNLNMALYLQTTNIYRLGLGVDAFYDEAFADSHLNIPTTYQDFYAKRYNPDIFEQRIRGGACLSNEFVIGRVTAALDGGYYFYDNIKPQFNENPDFLNNTYFRFAMKYRFTTGLFGVVALKTHMLSAEYVTFGLGYSILL